MFLLLILVSWCIILHSCISFGILPVSPFEPAGIDGTSIALNPFVMMAEELSRFEKAIICVREVILH